MTKRKHYVDNKQLYATLVEYRDARLKAIEEGTKLPPIPNYIGECLLQIATRLSYKPNFANYMFREEMIGDGIENCINYLNNFNPDKSKNPFAYFTQIIYYAFLRRIDREKKQLYVKHKALENSMVMNELADQGGVGDDSQISINIGSDYMKDFVTNFEDKVEARKQKRISRKKGLENFYDDEEDGDIDEDSTSN